MCDRDRAIEEAERKKESVLIASLRHVAEIRMAVTYLGRAWSLRILRFKAFKRGVHNAGAQFS